MSQVTNLAFFRSRRGQSGHATSFETLSERYRQQLFRAAHRIPLSLGAAIDLPLVESGGALEHGSRVS